MKNPVIGCANRSAWRYHNVRKYKFNKREKQRDNEE